MSPSKFTTNPANGNSQDLLSPIGDAGIDDPQGVPKWVSESCDCSGTKRRLAMKIIFKNLNTLFKDGKFTQVQSILGIIVNEMHTFPVPMILTWITASFPARAILGHEYDRLFDKANEILVPGGRYSKELLARYKR